MPVIQPNSVTSARYDFTPLQKNIVYMIIKELQRHMSKEKYINQDLFRNFVVSVPITPLAGENNHAKVIEAAKELMQKPMEYSYSRNNRNYTVATVIIHTAKHEHGSDTVELYVPLSALSLLLYIGKGFTIYQLPIALSLKSKYSKRFYEFCCRWKDRGGYSMSVQELRQMLKLENKYRDIKALKDRVLDVAKKELKQSADVWFDYKMEKVKSRSFNYIYFTIEHNDLKAKNASKGIYPKVYNYLTIPFPPIINDRAMRIADKLADNDQLIKAWGIFKPILGKYQRGEMDAKFVLNLTKKILAKDFSIKTD